MNKSLFSAVLAVMLFTGFNSVHSTAEDAEFVSMFDGQTLNGWEVMPGSAKAAWSVQDGLIVGEDRLKPTLLAVWIAWAQWRMMGRRSSVDSTEGEPA